MHLIVFLLAAALAAPEVTVAEQASFDDATDPAVEEAHAALAAGRFDDAARQFEALADASGDADLQYLTALSRYEAGDLRRAERDLVVAVAAHPDHGPLLNLQGLVLADLGRGEQALSVLERAEALAKATDDEALLARVVLNQGLVHLDSGSLEKAERTLSKALTLAEASGDVEVVARAAQNVAVIQALLGKGGGTDLVGRVADALRRGDLEGARAMVPEAASGRRARIERTIALAAVARAESRYDTAATALQEALLEAREGGLMRERVSILGELGVVQHLAGRPLVAREHLREGLDLVEGSTFRTLEIDLRSQLVLVGVALGDNDDALVHLRAGQRLAEHLDYSLGDARLSEAEGVLDAARGDVTGSEAAYVAAIDRFDKLGAPADAARVATRRVGLYAGRDEASAKAAEADALARFERAGDPLGPAHVAMAQGLALASRKDLEGALRAFVQAAELAERQDSPRGRSLAEVARANCAEALRVLGHGPEATERAAELGLEAILARQDTLAKAREAWEEGMAAWEARDYAAARQRFDTAYLGFRELGEQGYARTARRGRAWALWNQTIGTDANKAFPFYEEVVQEAIQIDDPELRVRAREAKALAALEIPGIDASPLLVACAEDAESIGMIDVASRCWAGQADVGEDLVARASAARKALDTQATEAAVYAMYSVAVDAYNSDRYDLATDLCREVLPVAGGLADAVTAVLSASEGAAGEP